LQILLVGYTAYAIESQKFVIFWFYLTGLHSISFKKKQRIWDLTEEALNLPHAFDVDSVGKVRPNASIKTALLYIKNAAENIHVRFYFFILNSSIDVLPFHPVH
jgi:hypothetical protein